MNRLLARALGFAGRVDFLVPSFVVCPRHGEAAPGSLVARRDAAIYGEWAALLPGSGIR